MGYFESMVTPGGRYSVSKLSVEEVQRWIDKLKQTAFIEVLSRRLHPLKTVLTHWTPSNEG